MNFYCRVHPDFDGFDLGKLHDHLDRDHPEIKTKQEIAEYFREQLEMSDFRRSDGRMIVRSWGRPPKMGQWVADSEIDKK